jgi:uncharacterized membrane protein
MLPRMQNETEPVTKQAPVQDNADVAPAAGIESWALAPVVGRNIRALLSRRQQEERNRRRSERVADGVSAFAGSMTSVYAHTLLFGIWAVVNFGWIPGVKRFDPSFVGLATLASVEGIFLSTFVLITQNRQQARADRQAELELQVSLLSEHEITRLVSLTTAIAHKMGIAQASDPELAELSKDIWPERVLTEIERTEQKAKE